MQATTILTNTGHVTYGVRGAGGHGTKRGSPRGRGIAAPALVFGAEMRLAEEYDDAQERGEAKTRQRHGKDTAG
jgi:hypothetical protein